MRVEEAIGRFHYVADVVGSEWMQTHKNWFEGKTNPPPIWYAHLDWDLSLLAKKVPVSQLIGAYRHMLRDHVGLLDAVYEIHAAAFLADIGDNVALHVRRATDDSRNFDVQVSICGHRVNADCKTRRDRFPFNMPRTELGFEGSRATLDPHDFEIVAGRAENRPWDPTHISTPESTVVQQILLSALQQLPSDGSNLVLFGQVDGSREHLERALHGVPVLDIVRDHHNKTHTTEWRVTGTAAFRGDGAALFSGISAVLWFRIMQTGDDVLRHAYSIYVNPNATVPLHEDVRKALDAAIAQLTV